MGNPADSMKSTPRINEQSRLPKLPIFNDADVVRRLETWNVRYDFTPTMFRKTSRLPWVYMDLEDRPIECKRLFNHDRINNEVNALKLVSQKTTIPVPRLLDYGVNPDGTRYLVTELIDGVNLDKLRALGCRITTGQKHTEEASCDTCVCRAYANAINFVENTVLPQLSTMKSHTRGIVGFVMPPAWLPIDTQKPWKGRKGPWKTLPLATPEYVFQHGDLAAHNLLIDMETLQPKALIDWEFAGYYPPGMDLWSGTLDFRTYVRSARGDNMAELIRKYIPEDFLEACSQLEDKENFDLLVRSGYFPDPEELRASTSTPVIQKN
ncbi:putative protein kinase-like domain protein [Botrytis fragariae]|uniref:Aminoglycoside phosphotransferase domain-containing protein n=1 Tax=Botrytis fragariae TaxID=1964551 RepID=A0A8H6EG95_9HELO|nr:putative protein kinase-like domain protein [Botrytis fragariae]KAF5870825.1 putative protein kinase-like domain protein [Botrytis fragariae]